MPSNTATRHAEPYILRFVITESFKTKFYCISLFKYAR